MADEPIDPKGTLIQRPLRVVLLAYDGMNLLDLAGPLQALNTANRSAPSGEPARYEMIVASGKGGNIVTSAGLPVVTVAVSSLADTPIDTLIAPGGCVGEEYEVAPALSDFIARRAGTVRRLCSVCTGAFLLAAAGQLDGRRVATHWAWLDKLKQRHPTLDVDPDSIFIRDGNLWTSAGVSSGIDLIGNFRYVDPDASLETLLDLYAGAATEGERKPLREAAKRLAGHELEVGTSMARSSRPWWSTPLRTWLEDGDARIRTFAEGHIRYLDRAIAAETRRAQASQAARRLDWGEDAVED